MKADKRAIAFISFESLEVSKAKIVQGVVMGDCEIVTTVIFVVGVVTIVSFALAVYTQVELSGLAHDGTTVLEHHDQQIKKGIKVIARHDKEIEELQQTVSIELLPALSQLQAYLGTTTTTTGRYSMVAFKSLR